MRSCDPSPSKLMKPTSNRSPSRSPTPLRFSQVRNLERVQSMQINRTFTEVKGRFAVCALLGISLTAFAQNNGRQDYPYQNGKQEEDSYASRTRAVDESESRAEKEAERLVSLPAEKILILLQREPGLFLQVKKLLVRKAYQEGRVVDPKDLTDDAVFRQIRQDENVRVLITNEIVDRNYIRLKPSQKELEQEWQRRSMNARAIPESGTSNPYGTSQQDEWSGPPPQVPMQAQPAVPGEPGTRPNMPSPQSLPPDDPRRKLLQAQAQGADDASTGLPLDVLGDSTTPDLTPDQMVQLMNARNQAAMGGASKGT